MLENLQALAASAAPVPEPSPRAQAGPGAWAAAGARALVRQMSGTHGAAATRGSASGFGGLHSAASGQLLPSADKPLAYTMPVGKQLRVLLVLGILLATVAHQVCFPLLRALQVAEMRSGGTSSPLMTCVPAPCFASFSLSPWSPPSSVRSGPTCTLFALLLLAQVILQQELQQVRQALHLPPVDPLGRAWGGVEELLAHWARQ